ncbi:MAG: hypothetical protein HYU04_00540 [Candidatus Wildermuthbacteria bacterium]|nr:hypothetical protein [Candidatus Wildermuthbacteria bacterium]
MKQSQNFKHRWSILCRGSSIDKESNNLSIFNVLEELRITPPNEKIKEREIFIQLPLQIVTLWERRGEDKTTSEVEIELFDPIGKALQKISYPLSTPQKRIRSVVNTNGIKVTESGEYLFKVKMRNDKTDRFEEVEEIPLQIAITFPFPNIKKP